MMPTEVYVILWSFFDKSGFGIVRSYLNKARAERDLEMLRTHGDNKEFTLITSSLEAA